MAGISESMGLAASGIAGTLSSFGGARSAGSNLGAGLSAGLGLLAGGLSAYGNYQQSQAWANFNAASAKGYMMQAGAIMEKAGYETEALRLRGRKLLATQRQLFGYAGVELSGTPADLQAASEYELGKDEEILIREAQTAAAIAVANAAAATAAEQAAKKSGKFGAAAGVIGAVGGVIGIAKGL